jgi:hypothetical protein
MPDSKDSPRIIIANFLKQKFEKLFCFKTWNIGIAKCNIADLINFPNPKIDWLHRPSLFTFRADPFGLIDKNHNKKIFFEEYNYLQRKGFISCLELDKNLKILNHATHLSYPYIFSDGDKKFAFVESRKEKNSLFTKSIMTALLSLSKIYLRALKHRSINHKI